MKDFITAIGFMLGLLILMSLASILLQDGMEILYFLGPVFLIVFIITIIKIDNEKN